MQTEEACLGGKTQSQTEQILRGIFSFYDWYVNLQHYSIDQSIHNFKNYKHTSGTEHGVPHPSSSMCQEARALRIRVKAFHLTQKKIHSYSVTIQKYTRKQVINSKLMHSVNKMVLTPSMCPGIYLYYTS